MPRTMAFPWNAERYDAWFERHPFACQSELEAVASLLPTSDALEVGVGTGRFAVPLGVRSGVKPAAAMRAVARERGVDAADGVAEALPYPDAVFDAGLMVTTLCFLDDVAAALREAWRVLRPGGRMVVGFVDSGGVLGRHYVASRAEDLFTPRPPSAPV